VAKQKKHYATGMADVTGALQIFNNTGARCTLNDNSSQESHLPVFLVRNAERSSTSSTRAV
jgi:hypothetical protein